MKKRRKEGRIDKGYRKQKAGEIEGKNEGIGRRKVEREEKEEEEGIREKRRN